MKDKPIYLAIEEQIEDDINVGIYKSGAKLPTERELMEKYSVSRMTIRQVINNLVGRGLVYRIKGKGAFVHEEIFLRNRTFRSITSLMAERGISVETKVLDFKVVLPDEITRLKLNMVELETAYLVKRARIVSDYPIAVEMNYLPSKLYPGFETHDFAVESIYNTLETVYHKNITHQKEVVSAVAVPPEIGEILYKDEKLDFALKIENLIMNEDSEPLMLGSCFYHAEKYSYFNINSRNIL